MKNPVKKLLAIAFVMGASTASADVPRTLASGAPACGNTGGKGDSECELGRDLAEARVALRVALAEKRKAIVEVALLPRVQANGSPACGNTMAKPLPECIGRATFATIANKRANRVKRAVAKANKARAELRQASTAWRAYTNDV